MSNKIVSLAIIFPPCSSGHINWWFIHWRILFDFILHTNLINYPVMWKSWVQSTYYIICTSFGLPFFSLCFFLCLLIYYNLFIVFLIILLWHNLKFNSYLILLGGELSSNHYWDSNPPWLDGLPMNYELSSISFSFSQHNLLFLKVW